MILSGLLEYTDIKQLQWLFTELSYLLSGNGHVVLDISKHSRLDEVSSVCSYSSSTHQLGSFSLATADVPQNLVELLLIYLESLLEERASIVCDGAKYSTLRATQSMCT